VQRKEWTRALTSYEALLGHAEDAEVLRRAALAAEKAGRPDLARAYALRADRAAAAA